MLKDRNILDQLDDMIINNIKLSKGDNIDPQDIYNYFKFKFCNDVPDTIILFRNKKDFKKYRVDLTTKDFGAFKNDISSMKDHPIEDKNEDITLRVHYILFYLSDSQSILKLNPFEKTYHHDKGLYPRVELFNINYTQFNYMYHEIQPKFTLIRANNNNIDRELNEKYDKIFKDYYDKSKLSKICIDDPVTKYYNAEHDDIFEIRRTDSLFYRIVNSNKRINAYKK